MMNTHPVCLRESHPLNSLSRIINAAGIFLFTTCFFFIPFYRYLSINPEGDFRVHVEYAKTIHSLADMKSPHFRFELAPIAIAKLFSLPLDLAAPLLISVAYGGIAILIFL